MPKKSMGFKKRINMIGDYGFFFLKSIIATANATIRDNISKPGVPLSLVAPAMSPLGLFSIYIAAENLSVVPSYGNL
jgi:hypothetical protein